MSSVDFQRWFEDLVQKECLEDVKFALKGKDFSVRELKEEFRRLHTMAEAGITLPAENGVQYIDKSLDEAIASL